MTGLVIRECNRTLDIPYVVEITVHISYLISLDRYIHHTRSRRGVRAFRSVNRVDQGSQFRSGEIRLPLRPPSSPPCPLISGGGGSCIPLAPQRWWLHFLTRLFLPYFRLSLPCPAPPFLPFPPCPPIEKHPADFANAAVESGSCSAGR